MEGHLKLVLVTESTGENSPQVPLYIFTRFSEHRSAFRLFAAFFDTSPLEFFNLIEVRRIQEIAVFFQHSSFVHVWRVGRYVRLIKNNAQC